MFLIFAMILYCSRPSLYQNLSSIGTLFQHQRLSLSLTLTNTSGWSNLNLFAATLKRNLQHVNFSFSASLGDKQCKEGCTPPAVQGHCLQSFASWCHLPPFAPQRWCALQAFLPHFLNLLSCSDFFWVTSCWCHDVTPGNPFVKFLF